MIGGHRTVLSNVFLYILTKILLQRKSLIDSCQSEDFRAVKSKPEDCRAVKRQNRVE